MDRQRYANPHLLGIALAYTILVFFVQLANSDILTVGNQVGRGFDSIERSPSTWLDMSTYLPSSVIIRWRIYCQTPFRPIRLQIWRPMPPGGRYLLLAEHRVVPTAVGIAEYELSPRHRIPAQSGDFLGFTLEDDANPVPFRTSSETRNVIGAVRGYFDDTSPSALPMAGNIYKFNMSDILHREYSVNVDIVVCRPPWRIIDVHCARTGLGRHTWQSAHAACDVMKGHLATPSSSSYSMALRNIMVMHGFTYIWIGVEYDNNTINFVWADDSKTVVKEPPWSAGEPSTTSACTSLTVRGEWDMKNCSYKSFYICQAKGGYYRQTPPTVDTSNSQMTSTVHTTGTWLLMNTTTKVNCEHNPGTWECIDASSYIIEKVNQSFINEITLALDQVSRGFPRTNLSTADVLSISNIISELAAAPLSNYADGISGVDKYLQSVASAASLILGDDCRCYNVWQQLTWMPNSRDNLQPMTVAEDVEAIVHGALQYVANRSTLISIETRGPAMAIHMEVIPKKDLSSEFLLEIPKEHIDVNIPKQVFSDSRDSAAIAVIMYDSLDKITGHISGQQPPDVSGSDVLLSPVLSIGIYPPPVFNGETWIQFTLHNRQTVPTGAIPRCSYWKQPSNYGSGWWVQEGCEVVTWSANHTVCRCQHLTNFAILVQLHPVKLTKDHHMALSIITYIGCGLSICGSLATILLHLIARCFTERAKILMNLSLALLIAHATFITGVTATRYTDICRLIAVVLHYFFTASFFWMLAQGIALYVKVKIIFKTQSRFIHYCLLGWGLPAIIVAVSVGMRYDDYGNENYCWLSMQTGLVWGFIGPIIVIASVNFFILCILMRSFSQTKYRTESPGTKDNSKFRSSARAAIVMLPVLGLTWIFGLLSVNRHTIIFQYLFGMCNSTQGFAIFLLHCVFNDEIHSSWHRQLRGAASNTSSSQRDLSVEGEETNKPKSILKRTPSNTSTSSTKSVTLRQSPESVSPKLWDVDSSNGRFSLGCLIPGRSKVIPITDPKIQKVQQIQRKPRLNGNCVNLY